MLKFIFDYFSPTVSASSSAAPEVEMFGGIFDLANAHVFTGPGEVNIFEQVDYGSDTSGFDSSTDSCGFSSFDSFDCGSSSCFD